MKTEDKPRELTTIQMVSVAVGMAITFGLLGYTLTSIGLAYGGTTGKWIGLTAAYALMCLICFYASRMFIHRSVETVCVIFILMGAIKVGEEIGNDVATPFAKQWSAWITFAIAFAILYVGGKLIKLKQ